MAITECNEALHKKLVRYFENPFDISEVSCLEGNDPLGHVAVADYKMCALSAGLSVGLNAVALLPAARELRHMIKK